MAAEPDAHDPTRTEGPTVSYPADPDRRRTGPMPARIGDYRVLRPIADGGMGLVYECHDERLDIRVAVKVAHPSLASQPGALEAVRDEGRRLASVRDDQHLIRVLAAGEIELDGVMVPWIAMRYHAEAEPLGGPLSNAWGLEKKVEALITLCHAVEALHAQHLVHADIKPDNVLLVEGRPYLIDFGIARVVRRLGGEPGQAIGGTPGYFDPALGTSPDSRPDQRTDIYCLGVTAAVFLTRRPPEATWPSPERPPNKVAQWIDADLNATLVRALEPSPDQRWQNVAELRAALERWLAFHSSPLGRAVRAVGEVGARWPLLAWAATVVLAAAVGYQVPAIPFIGALGIATQPTNVPMPDLAASVRLIELDDPAEFEAAARATGAAVDRSLPGGMRAAWATLFDRLADAGGARLVAADLMFKAATSNDAPLERALGRVARATDAGAVVVGLERWGDVLPESLRAGGLVRGGCVQSYAGDDTMPAVIPLAVQRPGEGLALPSLSLLAATLATGAGADVHVRVDEDEQAVRSSYVRRDGSGTWTMPAAELAVGPVQLESLPDANVSLTAQDKVAILPVGVDLRQVDGPHRISVSRAMAMPLDDLRLWMAGRVVLICDRSEDPCAVPGGSVPGSRVQAAAIATLMQRSFVRFLGSWHTFWLCVAAGAAGGLAGAAAANIRGTALRAGVVALACVAVVWALSAGCAWYSTTYRYLVNPLAVWPAGVLGCVGVVLVRRAAVRAAGA